MFQPVEFNPAMMNVVEKKKNGLEKKKKEKEKPPPEVSLFIDNSGIRRVMQHKKKKNK